MELQEAVFGALFLQVVQMLCKQHKNKTLMN